MKKISILLILVLIATFFLSKKIIAQVEPLQPLPTIPIKPIYSTKTKKTYKTKPFGGKIIAVTQANSSIVVCNGTGKLIVLSKNATGLVKIASSQIDENTYSRALGTAEGVSQSIPFYTGNIIDNLKIPKAGGSILGHARKVPDISTCHINLGPVQIPLPVFIIEKYNVSGKLKLNK